MAKSNLPPVPSTESYKEALLRIRGTMPEKHLQMLLAHYGAPNHTITATELAKAVGYKGFQAVNLQYGQLGRKLRDVMGYAAEGQASYVIASFLPPGAEGNPDWLWIMHPEIARALEDLKWA